MSYTRGRLVGRLGTLVGLVVLLTGCGLAIHGAVQTVSLASDPIGAEVFVDGVLRGQTPLGVTLSRGQSHTVEFRLAGRESRTVVIQNVTDPASVGLDLLWGVGAGVGGLPAVALISLGAVFSGNSNAVNTAVLFLVLIGAAPLIIDASTGAASNLQPGDVMVTLPPAAESPGPEATP